MEKREQIEALNKYKEALLFLKQYQEQPEEKTKEKEPQKVLVLRKKFGNKWLKVG